MQKENEAEEMILVFPNTRLLWTITITVRFGIRRRRIRMRCNISVFGYFLGFSSFHSTNTLYIPTLSFLSYHFISFHIRFMVRKTDCLTPTMFKLCAFSRWWKDVLHCFGFSNPEFW